MNDWNIEKYKYQSPSYRDYPPVDKYGAEVGNPNYHYGYTHFPSYTDMPLPPYEQMMRAEQKKMPAHMICDCGGYAPIGGIEIVCVKCGKNWGSFVGSKTGNDAQDRADKGSGKERFSDLSSADNAYIVLLFVFFIFLSCLYVHICALRTELDIMKSLRPSSQ